MAGNDIGHWYRSIPDITRYWFSAAVAVPLLGRFGLLPFRLMVLSPTLISRFEIWRAITSVIYYPITPSTGFNYLIMLYFLYNYSNRLETGVYAGKPGDYVFLIIFNWLALLVLGLVLDVTLLFDAMIMSVVYVWCQLNKDTIVQFWFGTQFKAMYLPWILLAFNLIIRGGGMAEILGIVTGHLYFFLMFKYPQDFGGRQLISVPNFIYTYFPNHRGTMSGFGHAPSVRRAQPGDQGGRHAWGQGNQLGGQ